MQRLIQQLRDQHQDLLKLAEVLEATLDEGAWRENPGPMCQGVRAFIEVVADHLDLEDEQFYPPALLHPRAGALARQYQSNLGHLRETAAAYLEAWPDSASILAHPQGFEDYTRAFLRFLHRRIHVEEEELYPAVGGP